MNDFIEGCTVCGRTFKHGDVAYTTADGEIVNPGGDYNVFEPSDAPHLTVACEACSVKCSEAIANINKKDTRPDVTRQLLKAVQDAEYLLSTGGPGMDMNDVIAGLQAAMARAKEGGITL